MAKELKDYHSGRRVTEVGAGDYVKVGTQWERIVANTAAGDERAPRDWTIKTESGKSLGMFQIGRYAKAEDFEE